MRAAASRRFTCRPAEGVRASRCAFDRTPTGEPAAPTSIAAMVTVGEPPPAFGTAMVNSTMDRAGVAGATGDAAGEPARYPATTPGAVDPSPSAGSFRVTYTMSTRGLFASAEIGRA